jgi:hypothetical protein
MKAKLVKESRARTESAPNLHISIRDVLLLDEEITLLLREPYGTCCASCLPGIFLAEQIDMTAVLACIFHAIKIVIEGLIGYRGGLACAFNSFPPPGETKALAWNRLHDDLTVGHVIPFLKLPEGPSRSR